MTSALTLRAGWAPLDLWGKGIPPLNWNPEMGRKAGVPGEVQVLVVDAGGRRLVLVGADLLWFSDALVNDLRPGIADRCACPEAAVSLTATHTHGASQPDLRFPIGRKKHALCEEISAAVRAAVDRALQARPEPVSLTQAVVVANRRLTVNRRRKALYLRPGKVSCRVQNLPNPALAVDRRLTSLVFRRGDGAPAALINHFTCHAVADTVGTVGADYPGHLRGIIRESLGPDFPVLFLQGFCGDVRPDLRHKPEGLKDHLLELLIGPRFRPPNNDDSTRLGRSLAALCLDALPNAVPLAVDGLAACAKDMVVCGESGQTLDRVLRVTTWRIGADCRMVFASGEMLTGLAPDDGALSVGYSNGMVGYVAPESEYAGGGYEIDGFRAHMALEERIAPGTGAAYLALRGQLLAELDAAP